MKLTTCINNGCDNPVENKDTGECGSCARVRRKAERRKEKEVENKGWFRTKRIKPRSDKRAKEEAQYNKRSKVFLQGKQCAVYPDKVATQVHHKKGRIGYADQWARDRKISLLLDERFWLPVSMDAHIEIENNPEWAKKNGYSLNRL